MDQCDNIVLMGLRGSGKSTLGRLIALELDRTFIDLDDMTVMLLGGNSVTEVWKQGGETGFRKAEAAVLKRALAAGNGAGNGGKNGAQVIALGGGTPIAPGADGLMSQAADRGDVFVYLRASAATLRARLAESGVGDRPSLTGGADDESVVDEIETVLEQRDELYRKLATHVIEVDGLTERCVVEKVLAAIG